MQRKLFVMMLILGLCNTKGFAQEKEYHIGVDGFEWYEVKQDLNGKRKRGVEDRYGNVIVPAEYDYIDYLNSHDRLQTGFMVQKNGYTGWYNKNGKCIISYLRGYKGIVKLCYKEWGTFYWVTKDNGSGLCDMNGKEIVFIQGVGNVYPQKKNYGKKTLYYFKIDKKGYYGEDDYGVADTNGKIVIALENKTISDEMVFRHVKTTNNLFANNRLETLAEVEGHPSGVSNSYSSSSSSSSSSTSSSSNSGNNSTTIHVEHHRDPVPVQEWVQCTACWGSGNCPDCAGSGTRYVGDNLRRCWRCGGRGRCSSCSGQGGRYYTVYK